MKLPEFLTEWPYGEIVLTGHRIGLFTVVRDYKEGRSAEGIAEDYPTLPLELVRKVIAFYEANRGEVDRYVTEYQAELDKQRAEGKHIDLNALRKRFAELYPDRAKELSESDPSWR
jgi:uncharacterized protein (DUF433 family)